MTDRELLEQIFIMQLYILTKVSEIDDDSKLMGINLVANMIGDMIAIKR